MASLIQQFDGKLAQVADDNAQLRVFCTHLEGLLAAAAAADGTGGNHGQGEAVGAGLTATGKASPPSSGTAANGAGDGRGCNVSAGVSAGSSTKHRPSPPFALRRESLGEVRRGSALAGPFQEVC